jgi:hypothetical protein
MNSDCLTPGFFRVILSDQRNDHSLLFSVSQHLVRLARTINALPKQHLILLNLSSVAILGAIDYLTGAELSITVFYLLPISHITWIVSRKWGFSCAVFSSAIEFIADYHSGMTYSHAFYYLWNPAMHAAFFFIIFLFKFRFCWSCSN